MGAREMCESVD